MPEPLTFVTGGSGVVGGAIVRHLVAAGRPVRALARSEAAGEVVRRLGAEPVAGDILDRESLLAAMAGCEVVYHAAGINRFCLRDPTPMRRANVTGSMNCMEAAARTGVRRVVYTSSAATLGEVKGTVGSEASPHRRSFLSAYERTKFEAEQAVLHMASVVHLDVVCVNPASVQGPGRLSGTGRLLAEYLRGRLKAWVRTTVSLVDIDDCAEGHLRAESAGGRGERYVLTGGSLDTDELMAVMRSIAPSVRPPRVVPAALARIGTGFALAQSRLRRQDPVVCGESLRALLHGHRYDGSKAERELGLRCRPVEETLRRTAEWLVEQGLVPAEALS